MALGSVITLRSHRHSGGLLHSHPSLYPAVPGAMRQQQITTYSHKVMSGVGCVWGVGCAGLGWGVGWCVLR